MFGTPDINLAFEKLESEAFDLPPRMRQMHGSCIAQPEIVTVANMTGGTQANRRHPRCNGRLDPTRAVFDHETFIRACAQFVGGKQKDVRIRLSSRHHIGTENLTAELRFQCQHRKAQPQTIDRTG